MSQRYLIALHDGDGNNSRNKETVMGQQSCEFCVDYFLFSKSLPSFTLFFLRPFVQYSYSFRFSRYIFPYLFLSVFLSLFIYFFLSLRCLLLFYFLSFLFSLFIFVFMTHNSRNTKFERIRSESKTRVA